MAPGKLFIGRRVRELREAGKATQAAFAERLGISTSYLNQIENNQRPVSAHALIACHQAYRRNSEQLASFDDRMVRADAFAEPAPYEEVRDFFHFVDNYIHDLDLAAERLAAALEVPEREPGAVLAEHLERRHGVRILRASPGEAILRRYDPATRALFLNPYSPAATRSFQMAFQIAGLEEEADRLSTLQRPGLKGVPVFFARIDRAGNITKRHSAARLQFARYGAACPLWNAHQAFETPGRIIRQLAETPDGVRYLCVATEIAKGGGGFNAPHRRYAIALGCEVAHAGDFVYGDGLDLTSRAAFDPIGISCRICERVDCVQRAVPPLKRRLAVDHDSRAILPYSIF